jgi:ABC-type dipeptide/oligopeptide/nickel transport system ATPase component
MPIRAFEFKDLRTGWHLERMEFGDFNLLVGESGVGKTRILASLYESLTTGRSGLFVPEQCRWSVELESESDAYTWSVETGAAVKTGSDNANAGRWGPRVSILSESILRNGSELASRRKGRVSFAGRSDIPKLTQTESLVSLFNGEEAMQPLHRTCTQFALSETTNDKGEFADDDVEVLRKSCHTLDDLRRYAGASLLSKARVIQERFPEAFTRVVRSFVGVFDDVSSVTVEYIDTRSELDYRELAVNRSLPQKILAVLITERGVRDPYRHHVMSSGMRRTLWHLLEVELSPPGTIIAIDEIENSLGTNCLPDVIDALMYRSGEIQVIATSHHPYIINNVPRQMWRVITRAGSTVTAKRATDFPALSTRSKQDAFLLLLKAQQDSQSDEVDG